LSLSKLFVGHSILFRQLLSTLSIEPDPLYHLL
jgi:hypothetical protein